MAFQFALYVVHELGCNLERGKVAKEIPWTFSRMCWRGLRKALTTRGECPNLSITHACQIKTDLFCRHDAAACGDEVLSRCSGFKAASRYAVRDSIRN